MTSLINAVEILENLKHILPHGVSAKLQHYEKKNLISVGTPLSLGTKELRSLLHFLPHGGNTRHMLCSIENAITEMGKNLQNLAGMDEVNGMEISTSFRIDGNEQQETFLVVLFHDQSEIMVQFIFSLEDLAAENGNFSKYLNGWHAGFEDYNSGETCNLNGINLPYTRGYRDGQKRAKEEHEGSYASLDSRP